MCVLAFGFLTVSPTRGKTGVKWYLVKGPVLGHLPAHLLRDSDCYMVLVSSVTCFVSPCYVVVGLHSQVTLFLLKHKPWPFSNLNQSFILKRWHATNPAVWRNVQCRQIFWSNVDNHTCRTASPSKTSKMSLTVGVGSGQFSCQPQCMV